MKGDEWDEGKTWESYTSIQNVDKSVKGLIQCRNVFVLQKFVGGSTAFICLEY